MRRFIDFPLVAITVVPGAALLGFCLSGILTLPFVLLLPVYHPSNSTIMAHMAANSQLWGLETIWLPLEGISLLLGLGLAGYETLQGRTRESLKYVVKNIFWFGLYLSVLTAPIICFLSSLHPIDVTRYVLLQNMSMLYDGANGFFIVLFAWVYSIKAGRVFTPRILANRLRYGRFHNPTS